MKQTRPEKKKEKAPTMAEVAAAAGVHQTTVSLAFRHHPSIPEATRTRLLEMARKMGYRPNPLVSALMGQIRHRRARVRNEVIAYVTSHFPGNPWRRHAAFVSMFGGARSRADDLGFVVQEFDLRGKDMNAARLKEILLARGIRGMIVAPLPDECTRFDLDMTSFAVVALGMSVKEPPLERISTDHFQSMQLAFAACLRKGYERIGFVVAQNFSDRLEKRWLGAYLCEQSTLPARRRLRPLLLGTDEILPEQRMKPLRAWAAREKPDVVISPLGAAQTEWVPQLTELAGIKGVVNLVLPMDPGPYAGVLQDPHKQGQVAVERVVSRLQHNDLGPLDHIQNTLLHGRWHDGDSLPAAG